MTEAASTSCPVCCAAAFETFGQFAFGGWRAGGGALERERFEYRFLECATCQHVMVAHDYGDAFVSALYGLPQTWERWSVEDLPVDAPYAEMVAFCAPHGLPPDGLVVDFGCGPGTLMRALTDRFGLPRGRLLGVDFTDRFAGEFTIEVADLNRLGADKGPRPFDGYTMGYCTHVLEHLTDPRGFLAALRRRARPGGWLYLEVPDAAIADLAASELANLHNAQHLHYFTLSSLRRLAESCGWTVEREDSSLFGFTPRARLLLRAVPMTEVRENTVAVLAHLDALWGRAGEVLINAARDGAPVALWGLGGDLVRMIDRSPELGRAVTDGCFRLIDHALCGRNFHGVRVESATALADGAGIIFLTPRPAKIRASMTEAAAAMGIDLARLRSPYAASENA